MEKMLTRRLSSVTQNKRGRGEREAARDGEGIKPGGGDGWVVEVSVVVVNQTHKPTLCCQVERAIEKFRKEMPPVRLGTKHARDGASDKPRSQVRETEDRKISP